MACLAQNPRQVTDRAYRYRANAAAPSGEKRCALCGNPGRVEVGHVDGHEENTEQRNLFYTCRSCNVLAGNAMRAAGAGRRTRQYNPEGVTSLGQWLTAVTSMKGENSAMSVHDAVAMIHATPARDRSKFAREIWSRRSRRNPEPWWKTERQYGRRELVIPVAFTSDGNAKIWSISEKLREGGMWQTIDAADARALIRHGQAREVKYPGHILMAPNPHFFTDDEGNLREAEGVDRDGPYGIKPLQSQLPDIARIWPYMTIKERHEYNAMTPAEREKIRKLEKFSNPLFLPKSLFDSYVVKSVGGGSTITIDKIQTIAGAEKKVKEYAKKYPCVGWEILSAKHGSVIKSYAAPMGPAQPKVNEDNTRKFTQQAREEAKAGVKYRLYVGGQEYATYDTRKEAEGFARDKKVNEGKATRIKEVMENPYRVMPREGQWEVAMQFHGGGWQVVALVDTKAEAERVMEKLRNEAPEYRGLRKPIAGFQPNPLSLYRVTHRGQAFEVLAASRRAAEDQVRAMFRGQARMLNGDSQVSNPAGARSRTATGSASGKGASVGKTKTQAGSASGKGASVGKTRTSTQASTKGNKTVTFTSSPGARAVFNPRATRKNPDGSGGQLFELFHGEEPTGEIIYETVEWEPDEYGELGPLVEIKFATIHGKDITMRPPSPDSGNLQDVVKLAGAGDHDDPHDFRQLYFIGGDQSLDLKKIGFSDSERRHHMLIGVLYEVTYQTEKKFHKFKLTDYFHHLGEDTKNQPCLIYDPYSERMCVVGGDYHIRAEGIVN